MRDKVSAFRHAVKNTTVAGAIRPCAALASACFRQGWMQSRGTKDGRGAISDRQSTLRPLAMPADAHAAATSRLRVMAQWISPAAIRAAERAARVVTARRASRRQPDNTRHSLRLYPCDARRPHLDDAQVEAWRSAILASRDGCGRGFRMVALYKEGRPTRCPRRVAKSLLTVHCFSYRTAGVRARRRSLTRAVFPCPSPSAWTVHQSLRIG